MSIQLSILTLNIWGIPWISVDREVRVRAIADQLAGGDYDVVSLQEVWSVSDYEYVRDRVVSVLPYAHYFYSGVLGSGLCVFSRHPIVGTLFHTWPVNGYVHRVHHGDWFGGKGVGLCRLRVAGGGGSTVMDVNVYVAHLHAEYDRENDDYKSHRVIQAFDTAQFIASTRGRAVLQVLAGDLNTEPGDLAYRSLLSVAGLRDACPTLAAVGTNECAHNAYTADAAKRSQPAGKRIDFLLYRGGHAGRIIGVEYSLPFPRELMAAGRAQPISYSDHEAVMAKFELSSEAKHATADAFDADRVDGRRGSMERLRNDLHDCIHLCDETLKMLHTHRTFYVAVAVATAIVLATVMDASVPYGCRWLFVGVRVALSGGVLFALFMATLWNRMEVNAVFGGRSAMGIALRAAVGDGGDGDAYD